MGKSPLFQGAGYITRQGELVGNSGLTSKNYWFIRCDLNHTVERSVFPPVFSCDHTLWTWGGFFVRRNVTFSLIKLSLAGLVVAGSVACGAAGGSIAPAASTVVPTSANHLASVKKCTDTINYRIDPRSNAEINSIGEQIGACPTPNASPVADTDLKCTDQIDYAGDSRSNAEINSIGADTGHCPTPR
jgi:hypothetical protein